MHRIVAYVLILAFATATSCSRYAAVPPGEYDQFDGSKSRTAAHWRVRTTDDRSYAVARFVITDSTLTIHKFDSGTGAADGIRTGDLPLVLHLDEVAAVEEVQSGPGHTVAFVAIGTAAGLFLIFAAVVAAGLGGLD